MQATEIRNIQVLKENVTTVFPLDGTDLEEALAIKCGHHVELQTHVQLMPLDG